MRARELRELTDDELDQKMAETRHELFNLRFQTATGVLENSARLRTAKRASTAVVAEIGALGGDHIAERASEAWHAGVDIDDSGSAEADPAAVFVDDMNVGLKVHQRSREQHNTERPAR